MRANLQFLFFLLITTVCSAQWQGYQWQRVDNFQEYTDGEILTTGGVAGWEAASDGNELYWFLSVPGEDDNVSIFLEPDLLSTAWMYRELPGEGIPPGGMGTLFLRLFTTGIDYDEVVWGVSDIPPEYGEQEIWEPFTALCRIDYFGQENIVQFVDQDVVVNSQPVISIEPSNWYRFWLVLDNAFEGTISTGSCTAYVQGPDDDAPVRITIGPDAAQQIAFRRPPVNNDGLPQALRCVLMASRNPWDFPRSAGDPWLIDDIHFSEGKNLTDPLAYQWDPPWANEWKDFDTGNWMGWINVWHAPWIWVYALDGWLYMEDSVVDAPGAWGYFIK